MTATRKYPKASDKNIATLTASQRNLLVRTALHVITEKIPPLDMRYYVKTKDSSLSPFQVLNAVNECGASCCMMGIAAFLNAKENPEDEEAPFQTDDWYDFGKLALGVANTRGQNGYFMFSGQWTNNRKQAAARVLLWLRGQDIEEGELNLASESVRGERFFTDTFLTHYSTAKLRTELKKFLVEE